MKILLINHNPVVSRLTSLSAKKEKVELDEIKEISELVADEYNIVFVDSESYDEHVSTLLQNAGIKTKVLFYAQGDEEDKALFNHTILKPFLPSEVSAILREVKIAAQETETTPLQEEKSVSFEELVENKENDLEELTVEETTPAQKDDFDLQLEEAFPLNIEEEKEEDKLPTTASTEKEKKEEKEPLLDLEESLFELDEQKEENGIEQDDLFELDKEIKDKIMTDDLLDLDLESQEEVSFDEKVAETLKQEEKLENEQKEAEPEKIDTTQELEVAQEETKVLDHNEVSNIKNLLADENNLSDENLTLDDIITPTAPSLIIQEPTVETTQEKPVEKEYVIHEETPSAEPQTETKQTAVSTEVDPLPNSAEVLSSTLSKLPTEELRKLLRGATVSITIQFPND